MPEETPTIPDMASEFLSQQSTSIHARNSITSSATISETFAQRSLLAKRKGLCVHCGVRTHKRSLLGKLVPLTNRDIWRGICRQCFYNQVPASEGDAMTAAPTGQAPRSSSMTAVDALRRDGSPQAVLRHSVPAKLTHVPAMTDLGITSADFLLENDSAVSSAQTEGGVLFSKASDERKDLLLDGTRELIDLIQQFALSNATRDAELLRTIGTRLAANMDLKSIAHAMEQMRDDADDLNATESRLVCDILWKVSALGDEEAIRFMIAPDSHAFFFVLDTQRRYRRDLPCLEAALGALTCILARTHFDGIARLVEGGGVELLLGDLFLHKQQPRILEWTSRCVLLVLECDEYAGDDPAKLRMAEKVTILLEQAHATTILFKALSVNSDRSARLWALHAIWRLCFRGSASGNLALSSLEGLGYCDYAMALLGNPHLTSRTATLIILDLLCGIMDKDPPSSTAYSSPERIVVVMFSRMDAQDADERVLAACCRVFFSLSRGDAATRLVMREANVLQGMINAYKLFPSSLAIAEILFGTLWRLATKDVTFFGAGQLRQLLAASEAIITKEGLSSSALLTSICGFLGSMVSVDDVRRNDIPTKILEYAFHAYVDDDCVGEEAIDALSHVLDRFPELLPAFLDFFVDLLSRSHAMNVAECMWGLLCSLPDDARNLYIQRIVTMVTKILALRSIDDATMTAAYKCLCTAEHHAGSVLESEDDLIFFACETILSEEAGLATIREAVFFLWHIVFRRPALDGHKLSMMQQSLIERLRRHVDRDTVDEELCRATCGVLTSIFRRLDARSVDVQAPIDVIISTLRVLNGNATDNYEALEVILEAAATLLAIDKDFTSDGPLIGAVTDIMMTYELHEEIQENCCRLLALLLTSESLQVIFCITENDGVDLVLSSLGSFTENARIRLNACAALLHLCIEEEAKTLVIEQGGLHMLCSLLSTGTDDVRLIETASVALHRLLSATVLDASMLLKVDILRPFIGAMRVFPGSSAVQLTCLASLSLLCDKAPKLRLSIIDCGGLDLILCAASTFEGHAQVMSKVWVSLGKLQDGGDTYRTSFTIHSTELVVNGLVCVAEDEEAAKCGCDCLSAMAQTEKLRRLIRQAGGCEVIAITACAHATSKELASSACRTLSYLAVPEQTALDIEIAAVVLTMTSSRESLVVQDLGCLVLRNYLPSKSNVAAMKKSALPVAPAVTNALLDFGETCSENAGFILSALQ